MGKYKHKWLLPCINITFIFTNLRKLSSVFICGSLLLACNVFHCYANHLAEVKISTEESEESEH